MLPQRTLSKASSSLLNQSDTSIHQEALHNGLFDDVEYYMQDIKKRITVGRYTAEQEMIEPAEIKLYQAQFKSLPIASQKKEIDKWIDVDVIDAFALAHIDKWDNVSYIPTSSTTFMIGDYHPKDFVVFGKTKNSIECFDKPF